MDLKEILEQAGNEVLAEAKDGFDAIEFCRKEHPDLIVLDVKMPLLDGLTAAKVITEENLADAVVLLTAYCDKEFVEAAKEAGVSGYFVKPVNENTFLPNLEIILDQNRKHKELEKEYDAVKKRLENRTVVEQAKGLVMKKFNLSEQEAYDYIRNISRVKNISMKTVSETILMSKEW